MVERVVTRFIIIVRTNTMFQTFSMAGTGWLVLLVGVIAKSLELDIDDGQITELANAVLLLVGFLTAVVGQLRRKDLTLGILRK